MLYSQILKINCNLTQSRFPGSKIPGFRGMGYRMGYKRCTQKPEVHQYTYDKLRLNRSWMNA